ncbi:hypothetical protein Cf24236_3578 [Citrobacter farmeri]|uniref:hypothetical protein n=1 Tax=Citrobacter farmeri TaxID=67824 RepID=UPI001C997EE0|nr:hypothetical protein [Citrobacter farmeri]QZE48306.1 hypothetical protein Cf24236_3578 [Citrobacter farmeri]
MIGENSYTSLHRSVLKVFRGMKRGGIRSLPIYMELVGRWEAENGNLDQMQEVPARILVSEPSIAELTSITGRSAATTRRYMKFLADCGLVSSGQNGTLSIAVYVEAD